jgi:hypothetical protein
MLPLGVNRVNHCPNSRLFLPTNYSPGARHPRTFKGPTGHLTIYYAPIAVNSLVLANCTSFAKVNANRAEIVRNVE